MTANEPNLPGFERPPVNEVVLGVQFEPLEKLQTAHLGLLWSRFRSQFPTVEEQPPLPPQPPEDLSGLLRPVELKVEMLNMPPVPRLLFVSEQGTELLQVQHDRFIANWRRLREEDVYPRYPHVRGYFEDGLRLFLGFVEEEGLGELRARQCEVIYLNQLPLGVGWERLGQLSDVLSFWHADFSDDALPEPEAGSVSLQFMIRGDGADEPRGRLYVDVRPSLRAADRMPLLTMNLTARVLTPSSDPGQIAATLDLGRAWIVKAFASLTTPKMHEIWGRRNGNP